MRFDANNIERLESGRYLGLPLKVADRWPDAITEWEGLVAMRHAGFNPALEMYKGSSQDPEICVKRSRTVLCEWR